MKTVRFSCSIAVAFLSSVTRLAAVTAVPKDSLSTSIPGFTGNLRSRHYILDLCLTNGSSSTKSVIGIMYFFCRFLYVRGDGWEACRKEEPVIFFVCFRKRSFNRSHCSMAKWWTMMSQVPQKWYKDEQLD